MIEVQEKGGREERRGERGKKKRAGGISEEEVKEVQYV